MSYSPLALIEPRFRKTLDGNVVSANERWLLRQIWLNPEIARSEITSRSELTQQSVHRILDNLGERGVINFGAPKSGLGRGQPSPMLSLNGSFAHSCGISVNTDVMGLCLMDLAGSVIGETSLALHGQGVDDALIEAEQKIAKLRRLHGLDPDHCFGIGFAIAGWRVRGTTYSASLPLHAWSLIELGPLLSDFFRKPVWVYNGANTGAIAETLFGVGRYVKNFAYLSFNYGFGGGLVSDSELFLGGNGNAGEFSNLFRWDTPHRPALQFLIEKLRSNGIDIHSVTQLQREFDPSWPGVAEWVEQATPLYNRVMDAIVDVFDPQAIVFGGQVPPALARMFIQRREPFGEARYGFPRPFIKLIVSEVSGDASALGAAAVPFKSVFF